MATRRKKNRHPKVKLSKKSVNLLAIFILLLCGGALAFFSYMSDQKRALQPTEKPAAPVKHEIAKPAKPVKPAEKKSITLEKSVSPPPKLPEVAKPSVAVAPKSTVSAKSSSSAPNEKSVIVDPFNIPKAKNNATVVLILDDAGRSVSNVKRYTNLPFDLTIAVLPKQKESKQCAQVIRSSGKELILHQPMQAQNLAINPGPGAILDGMSTWEIAKIINENLDELGGGVKGLNNHEGSLITSNEIKIGAVLDVCSSRGIYFLDSRTTAETKAKQAALERDMIIFEKAGPYIDNVVTRSQELERIKETLDYANKHGRAIVIAHIDKSVEILPDLLAELYPWILKAGYKFVTPSMLK